MGGTKLFPGRALVGKTSTSQTKPRGRRRTKPFLGKSPLTGPRGGPLVSLDAQEKDKKGQDLPKERKGKCELWVGWKREQQMSK